MFKCELLPDKKLQISVVPSAQRYFALQNEKVWLQAALGFAVRNDIFYETELGGEDLAYVGLMEGVNSKGATITDA